MVHDLDVQQSHNLSYLRDPPIIRLRTQLVLVDSIPHRGDCVADASVFSDLGRTRAVSSCQLQNIRLAEGVRCSINVAPAFVFSPKCPLPSANTHSRHY